MSEKDNWKWQKKLLIKRDKEHQEEIERLTNELEKQNIDYGLEIERLNNIINEAIEFTKNNSIRGLYEILSRRNKWNKKV